MLNWPWGRPWWLKQKPKISAVQKTPVYNSQYKWRTHSVRHTSTQSARLTLTTNVQSNLAKGRIADLSSLVATNGFVRSWPLQPIKMTDAVRSFNIPMTIWVGQLTTSVQIHLAKGRIADLSPLRLQMNSSDRSWPPSFSQFPGPTRISLPNGNSIGSAVMHDTYVRVINTQTHGPRYAWHLSQ